ncbi:MAG: DUF488 domain-containing protein [Candidatus Hadarchaeum sp.]
MRKIFTIGYGNRKFKEFVTILQRFGVKRVIDVRRFPTSKWSEFVKENLQSSLPAWGIDYIHLRELGGYRDDYKRYTKTKEFRRGLEKLVKLAKEKPSAIMCVEPHPRACHRRFVVEKLERIGWEIVHIGGNGELLSFSKARQKR